MKFLGSCCRLTAQEIREKSPAWLRFIQNTDRSLLKARLVLAKFRKQTTGYKPHE